MKMPLDKTRASPMLNTMTGTGCLAKNVPISVNPFLMAISKLIPSLSMTLAGFPAIVSLLVSLIAEKKCAESTQMNKHEQ